MVDEIPPEPPPENEALRLKELAEEKFTAGNLKSALKYAKRAERLCPSLDGISEMITAFKVLRSAAQPVPLASSSDEDVSCNPAPPDYYEILQVERFAHINIIKKQYKKLALVLHPDKNTFVASEEAFKHVGEAFRVLSDRIRRKEYDMKVRIAMQDEVSKGLDETRDVVHVETFWTLCSTCRLLHKFDRKYLGHNLMCPSCRKSFKAFEVDEEKANEEVKPTAGEQETVGVVRVSERIQARKSGQASGKGEELGNARTNGKRAEKEEFRFSDVNELRSGGVEVIDSTRAKRAKVGDDDEMLTLAQFRKLAKKRGNAEKIKSIEKGLENVMLHEMEMGNDIERVREVENGKKDELLVEHDEDEDMDEAMDEDGKVKEKIVYRRASKMKRISEIGKRKISRHADSEEPSFYDFDKDRQERSFKKGQVWAAYEDNEGMPRNYALVEEIVSVNPFELILSWLDYQSNGDDQENKGFHIACGKFKVSDQASVTSLRLFSHVADSERIAREIYWIYPKKGSVWALYNRMPDSEDICTYSIVVLLTTYSDKYGMSVAYLAKVDGFRSVFKRREVGANAPLLLSKDDFRLFSHQIPARKVSSEDATGLTGDCWELDPCALPSDPLSFSLG